MAVKDEVMKAESWSEHATLSASLDQRILAMRQLLALMKPASTASALKVLRDSFPDIPLDERVRALSATMH